MGLVATEKIEYTPSGGGPARIILPWEPIPGNFPEADIPVLVASGAIEEQVVHITASDGGTAEEGTTI